MLKSKSKPWEKMFKVDKVLRQLPHNTWQGREGDWVESITVLNKDTGEPVTKRFYSRAIDARRGAAQIYNRIEKVLLGSTNS